MTSKSHTPSRAKRSRAPKFPEFRSPCPVASALDLLGDKWSLVVLRTILAGASRFGDLSEMREGIASNILADRLEKLERYGLIGKTAYREHPTRHQYWLTEAGADLLPVLQALAVWSSKHIAGRWKSPSWFTDGTPRDFVGAVSADPRRTHS